MASFGGAAFALLLESCSPLKVSLPLETAQYPCMSHYKALIQLLPFILNEGLAGMN